MFLSNVKVALNNKIEISVISESSVLLSFNSCIETMSLSQRSDYLSQIFHSLMLDKPPFLIDCILSYDTLLIEYDCANFDHFYVISKLRSLDLNELKNEHQVYETIHTIEVCYSVNSTQYPNDIELVSNHLNLTKSQIIDIHTNTQFKVFAIGFMPNFAYLGELPSNLNMPRLPQPRLRVPPGAVAIADNQTAIYPDKSPGGWHIIGYAPQFFSNKSQVEFNVGDSVNFSPINEQALERQTSRIMAGSKS